MSTLNCSSGIRILYEDNHILVVEKPANIPSQEDETWDADMLTLLKNYIKEKYQKPGEVFLGLVHRLDRPVGGVMVFARTSKAASRLSEQIRQHSFKKTYLAVVHGILEEKSGVLEHLLLKNKKTNTVKVVNSSMPDSKEARLTYEVLEETDGMSLVKINLQTGRPHQIRVQFSYIGHPLYGDHKYGNIKGPEKTIALRSFEIELSHPTLKEVMKFNCPPPSIEPWKRFNLSYYEKGL